MFTQHARLATSRAWWYSVLLMLVPLVASAQLQELKLSADDATGEDHYGRTLAMSGDRLAIGAMTTNDGNGAV